MRNKKLFFRSSHSAAGLKTERKLHHVSHAHSLLILYRNTVYTVHVQLIPAKSQKLIYQITYTPKLITGTSN